MAKLTTEERVKMLAEKYADLDARLTARVHNLELQMERVLTTLAPPRKKQGGG